MTGWTYYLPQLLPKHKIKMLGRFNVWKDGWLQASARFVSSRPAQQPGVGKLGAYATLDLGFEQKFKFWHQDLSLNAFITNVTGKKYQEQSGYHMPRQIYGVTVGTKF